MRAIGKLSGTRVKQCAVVRAVSGRPFRAPCACAEARKGRPDTVRLGWIEVRLVSKAQLADNGLWPSPGTVTRLRCLCGTSSGQIAKRLSALLRPLEVEWLRRRERASATAPCDVLAPESMQSQQLAASRLAEFVNYCEAVHWTAMDIIFIRDLRIDTIIGIYDWERSIKQTVRIDLELATDIARAAATDRIEDTLNYKAVAKRVIAFVEESSFQLVETLAERIVALVREEFAVAWVRLTLNKGGAVRGAQGVGVIIERGKRG